MTVHRPLLREIRALAEEYTSADECLEVAISRGILPEAASLDEHRALVSSDGKRLETFIAWASLGWERIVTAEALATEFHRNAEGAELPLRNIGWCIGGPLELGGAPAEAELVEMGLYVTLGLDGRDVTLYMPWRSSTGVPALDALIGGTREGSLVVIVGGAGTHKSTLAAMIAAGSEQHGSEPCYRSTEENRWFALERSVRQGFICPSYESYTGTVREHVDSFAASPCNIMLLDGMARMRYVALQEAMIDAKTAAVLHKSTVFVTLHQNNDGRLPGGFMTCADVVIMTASADRSVIVAVRKHSYGTTDSAVMFTIVDGGRLVWDRTSAIASRRSFE